ncbi:MAG: peptide-methionine (S)-S-oxide reductase MsrA [Phycisphaerae bacterium]|nr:peptide-methionine (S)-S-oxide reductase MsrA [Phycisphaerae bacterium]
MIGLFVLLSAAGYVALGGEGDAPVVKVDLEPLLKNPTYDKGLTPTGHSVPSVDARLEYATFGAGCFWGVEETFRTTKGVVATAVGFAGGKTERPSYKQVCYEDTGHAEVVHLQFDPSQVSYEALLEVFWSNHNPTTLNRQGPDVGTQYRSVIFYHGEAQKAAAERSKAAQQAAGKWSSRPIVTVIEAAPTFYAAEDYHQQYLAKRGLGSCHVP